MTRLRKMQQREVTVRKLLHDGRPSYVWSGKIVDESSSELVVEATFTHADRDLGYVLLEHGDRWVESYYFDRWYNIFEIHMRRGTFKGWYCNICRPAVRQDDELTFVDLALDLFVYPDGRYLVLDEEEFAQASAEEYLPGEIAAATDALRELIALARDRRLPLHLEREETPRGVQREAPQRLPRLDPRCAARTAWIPNRRRS